jgi:nitrogen fixation NifU-like protein
LKVPEPDLDDLYREILLDHNKNPRNFGRLEEATHHARGANPLCGDEVEVYLRLENDRVKQVSFVGRGCAISKASASMMTQALAGHTLAEVQELFERFHGMVTGAPGAPPPEALGDLEVFGGVRAYPMRVKCATMAWHTAMAALARKDAG